MPFWEKFRHEGVPSVKGVNIQSPNPLAGAAKVSLQSFGLALLRHELSLKRKQNVLLSPVSIFVALAMTENGAARDTKAAMRKALALPADLKDEEFNETAVGLLHSLRQQGEAQLEIANAL
jgi:serine protease inhibitor